MMEITKKNRVLSRSSRNIAFVRIRLVEIIRPAAPEMKKKGSIGITIYPTGNKFFLKQKEIRCSNWQRTRNSFGSCDCEWYCNEMML